MRARDLLFHKIVRHLLSRAQRRFARALEQCGGFSRRRQGSSSRIITSTRGFFQSVNQRSIVAALGRDQRTQAWSDRESNAALADLSFQVIALFRMARQLVEQLHEFLVRQRRALLQVCWLWEGRVSSLPGG